jgi:hypothetical protein
VVSVLVTGPKYRGFKPGRDDEFLRAIKVHSTLSFAREVKPEVLCSKILRHVKDPLTYQRYSFLRPFLLLSPDVSAGRTTRELWYTSQDLSPARIIIIIITTALHSHSPGRDEQNASDGRSSERSVSPHNKQSVNP